MTYSTIAVKEELKQELLLLQVMNRKKSMEELLHELLEVYKKSKEEK